MLMALQVAVIFEDLVDTMTAMSNAIPAPTTEIRTAESIVEDDYFNRPRYAGELQELTRTAHPPLPKTQFAQESIRPLHLPPIRFRSLVSEDVERGSVGSRAGSSTSSTGQPSRKTKRSQHAGIPDSVISSGMALPRASSARDSTLQSLAGSQHGDNGVMNGYVLKQFYMPKVYKRVWQSNKDTPKRTFDEMVKNAGLKKSNPHHKLQADIGAIKLMMADIFNELVQKASWETLGHHLHKEKSERLRLISSSQRLLHMRRYSKHLRAQINETRQSKKKELDALKLLEHQIEDEGQELSMRTEVEDVYTQNYVNAKIHESLKASAKAPNQCLEELTRLDKWLLLEDAAHYNWQQYLVIRIDRVKKLLDYWVEKYETDKERLMADLEELKEERAATAAHRERIQAKIKLWMPIIKDNRRVLELQEEKDAYILKCAYYATKVAARWRGYMVRAGLGNFRELSAMRNQTSE
ncbi:IQ domain-containing protein G [Elysia marginata]|uniref:IQ domain-containing protein G n=1 Tax=Elysia marginata TaxID=1093978 RepID=A0AAV4J081_9GAST|nr:IQ domain-containing protein G [Elysia marginata]